MFVPVKLLPSSEFDTVLLMCHAFLSSNVMLSSLCDIVLGSGKAAV